MKKTIKELEDQVEKTSKKVENNKRWKAGEKRLKKLEDEFRRFNIQIISFRERRHKNGGKEIINGTSQEPFFRN